MEQYFKLKNELLKLLGLKICKIGIVVWPDSDGLEETDVKLYIEFLIPQDENIGVLFGTSEDGQTPSLEFSILKNGIPFSSYETMRKEWNVPNYIESQASISRVLFSFSLENKDELASVIGENLSQVYLVTRAESVSDVTGVVLDFTNGKRVWSAPATYGNKVSMNIDDYWWSGIIKLRPISSVGHAPRA